MSHLGAIGFEIPFDEFVLLLDKAMREACIIPSPHGFYLCWEPTHGIQLWLQASEDRRIIGCHPHFVGNGRIEARVVQTSVSPLFPMEGKCLAWAVPTDPRNPSSGIHSLAAELPDFDCVVERISTPPRVTLQIAAFAEEIASFPTMQTFLESDFAETYGVCEAPLWRQILVGEEISPEAFLTGVVLNAAWQENRITAQPFITLSLLTRAGTLDVVASLDALPQKPMIGSFIAGRFWLSGRVVGGLPPLSNEANQRNRVLRLRPLTLR